MRERYCYWSVATGPQARLLQTLVDSARAVGVFKDFHVWSDRRIEGAVGHDSGRVRKDGGMFRLEFLEREVSRLPYEYYVWLEADSVFVRPPGDLLRVLAGAPVHASLESDVTSAPRRRTEWEGCSLTNVATLMRFCGVRNRAIFTAGAGFWIVHRDVIKTFCDLAEDFGAFCRKVGYRFGFEPRLAYAAQMLCGNPYRHTLRETSEIWGVDRAGRYAGKVPNGRCWGYRDDFTGERVVVNPAIVQAVHSRAALLALARRRAPAEREGMEGWSKAGRLKRDRG